MKRIPQSGISSQSGQIQRPTAVTGQPQMSQPLSTIQSSTGTYNSTMTMAHPQQGSVTPQQRALYRPQAMYSVSQQQNNPTSSATGNQQLNNTSNQPNQQQQYITLESQRHLPQTQSPRDHRFVAPSPIPAHLQSTATPSALTPYQSGTPGYPPSIGASTPMTPRTPADFGVVPPQLQNIVSTVNLGCKLDLKRIALHARNAEYNPKRFAAVIMRIREPRTTALIFSSGKMVCTGAKSEKESRLAARKYARVVQKLGFNAKFMDFRIQNMVGSVDVKFPIRLEGLVLTHSQFSSYEPELFPGLIYRMVKPRIVLLIFVSGKVVLTGAKVRAEIDEAFNNIYPILKGFRKPT